jgi:hypothetical protein
MVSNGFWHIVSVVKELRPPCPAEWLPNNFATIARTVRNVNTWEQRNSGFPQGSHPRTSKLLRRREIHAMQRCRAHRSARFAWLGQVAKIASRVRKSSIPVGPGRTLAVRSPAIVIFVVFIVDRQLMTRSEGYRVSVRKFFAARLMEATKKPNPQLQRHIRQATKRQNLPLPACGADRLSFGSSI